MQVDNVIIRTPVRKINNHFIPVKKEFAGNLRNNGRAVIDIFERNLARRQGYDLVHANKGRDFIKQNMVPQQRSQVKYGAYGSKVVVKENAYEYNRFNDPHLQKYLKRRKVKVHRPVTDLSQYYEQQQQSVSRLAKRKHEQDSYEYLSNSNSPQSRRHEESFVAYRSREAPAGKQKSWRSELRQTDQNEQSTSHLRTVDTDVELDRQKYFQSPLDKRLTKYDSDS